LIPRSYFVITSSADYRNLHSFPTRRSSDLDAHQRQADAGATDIHNRVDAADLVKVHGVRFGVVDLGLGLGQALEDRDRHVLDRLDRKSTRLNSSHVKISYAVFCLKKKRIG